MGALKLEQLAFDFDINEENDEISNEIEIEEVSSVGNFSPRFHLISTDSTQINKVYSREQLDALEYQFDYNAVEIFYKEIEMINRKSRFIESRRNDYSRHYIASNYMTPEYFDEVHSFSMAKVIEKFEVSRMVAMARIICERRESGITEIGLVRKANDLELERIGAFLASQKKKPDEFNNIGFFWKYYTTVFCSVVKQYYRGRVGRAITASQKEGSQYKREVFMEESGSENVEDRFESRDVLDFISKAIGRESEPELVQKALQLYIVEGYTMEEASAELGISKGKFQRCVDKIELILMDINPDYVREAERRGRNKKSKKSTLRLVQSDEADQDDDSLEYGDAA